MASTLYGFWLSACENSADFPAESGCKGRTLVVFYLIFNRSTPG